MFILLYVSYPLYTLVRLAFCYEPGYKHTLPNIERACNASFIRENMLVATVRDVDGGDAVLSTNEIPLAAPMAMVLPPAAVAARLAEAANLDGAFRLLPSELV